MKALIGFIFKTVLGFVALNTNTVMGFIVSLGLWGWAIFDIITLANMVCPMTITKDKTFAIAAAAMTCFAAGLMLKIDRGILTLLGVPEQWIKYAAILDHALVGLGGLLLLIHWIVKSQSEKGGSHEKV